MLGFLLLHGDIPPRMSLHDTWEDASGHYVYAYRRELRRMAQQLSREGFAVHTRFNVDLECAEMHTCMEKVVARIKIQGSEGQPWLAIVTIIDLPKEDADLIKAGLESPQTKRLRGLEVRIVSGVA